MADKYEEDEDYTDEEEIEYKEILSEIQDRCNISEIESKIIESEFSTFDYYLQIMLPESNQFRALNIYSLEEAREIRDQDFEQYYYIKGYEALVCYQEGWIISSIQDVSDLRTRGTFYPINQRRRRAVRLLQDIRKENPFSESDGQSIQVNGFYNNHNLSVSLGIPSSVTENFLRSYSGPLELRISNLQISTHLQATTTLEEISNSFFFQIEQESEVTLGLSRTPKGNRRISLGPPSDSPKRPEYSFPTVGYDKEPLSFYWHAVSAEFLPLMQYLSFYQCIEYFFPHYSRIDAKNRIRNILLRPNFRPNRETELNLILKASENAGRWGMGSEIEQLDATIQNCVSDQEIREFVEANGSMKDLFASDKTLKAGNISVHEKNDAVLKQVSERIYNIRCRIVHSKSGISQNSDEPILPYSNEESQLFYDIALVRLVAARVIAAGGRPIS